MFVQSDLYCSCESETPWIKAGQKIRVETRARKSKSMLEFYVNAKPKEDLR